MICHLFSDRKGLGKDSANKKITENKELDYKVDMGDFRQRKKDKLLLNRIWKDIRKCQHACEQLDKNKVRQLFTNQWLHIYHHIYVLYEQGYEPEEYWYWASTADDENDDDDDDYEVNQFYNYTEPPVVYS